MTCCHFNVMSSLGPDCEIKGICVFFQQFTQSYSFFIHRRTLLEGFYSINFVVYL